MSRYKMRWTLIKRGRYWYYRTYDELGNRTTAKSTGQKSKGAANVYCENLLSHNELVAKSTSTFSEYTQGLFYDNSVFIKDKKQNKKIAQNTLII